MTRATKRPRVFFPVALPSDQEIEEKLGRSHERLAARLLDTPGEVRDRWLARELMGALAPRFAGGLDELLSFLMEEIGVAPGNVPAAEQLRRLVQLAVPTPRKGKRMAIPIDPTRFRKRTTQEPEEHRYGAAFFTGEQEAVVLRCEEHVPPGAQQATSIRIVLGTDGPDGAKARHDHYVAISALERFENVLDVFAPWLKLQGGLFDPASLEGKRAVVILEAEETVGYGMRPALVRFVRLVEPAPKTPGGL